jgi:hypothetical protein
MRCFRVQHTAVLNSVQGLALSLHLHSLSHAWSIWCSALCNSRFGVVLCMWPLIRVLFDMPHGIPQGNFALVNLLEQACIFAVHVAGLCSDITCTTVLC